MKIALITDGIWPYVMGGMQKHSFYLCKYLAQNKIHVDLIHYNNSSFDINKLEFFSDEEKQFINSILIDFPKGNGLPGHYIKSSYMHSRLIFEAIKEKLNTYDFIYTKGFTGWYLIEQKSSGKINCPRIGVKFHGYEMFQKAPDFKTKLQHLFLLRRPVKWISQHADIVFSYGGKITDIIRSLNVPEKKIAEIPSGVESSVIANEIVPTPSKIRFLFLGRYERRKGVEELNQAIELISNQQFDFHFIGPIPEDKKLNSKKVTYHGEIRDKTKLNQLIRNCDVLLCPSWSEGMPNVILEAMANGLTVIATDVGATNVLVSNSNGWLLASTEPGEISKAMLAVVSSTSSEIDQKKIRALELIREKFNWEKLITDLLRIIKNE